MVEDNWPSVSANLRKAQKVWYCLSRILGREVTVAKTSGRFYIAVFQATMIFGLEICFMTPCMERTLGIFHHRVERRLTLKLPQCLIDGIWDYLLLAEAMQ